jgi:hypothetical protein
MIESKRKDDIPLNQYSNHPQQSPVAEEAKQQPSKKREDTSQRRVDHLKEDKQLLIRHAQS